MNDVDHENLKLLYFPAMWPFFFWACIKSINSVYLLDINILVWDKYKNTPKNGCTEQQKKKSIID